MEWPQELLDIFDDPIFDNVRPKTTPMTPEDRRVKTLIEITEWADAHNGRAPQSKGDLKEKLLARSLAALKQDAQGGIKAYDRLNLLEEE
jgi:hypothetical protein